MRRDKRRRTGREWARISPQAVTAGSYARGYGVDQYTAYEDLTAIGFGLPGATQ